MTDGCRVLDFGAGANPSIPVEMRPANCTYVGLDVSQDELEKAPAGAYDELIVGDISEDPAGLTNDFDLVVSWQVLEHVESMQRTLAGIRNALVPGGVFVSQFSGSNAWFSRLSCVVPQRATEWAMLKLLDRKPDSVFHAHYDGCDASKLKTLLADWRDVEIVPRYRGATYLSFSRFACHAYLPYENWAVRNNHANLATHYLIRAIK